MGTSNDKVIRKVHNGSFSFRHRGLNVEKDKANFGVLRNIDVINDV